jgi:predicted PurR-regulated permease PerM
LIAVGIAMGAAALAVFLWYSMHVLLLAFAAVLVGVLLRGSAGWVAAKAKIRPGWALLVVLLSLIGAFVLLGVFAAPSLVRQAEVLTQRIPQSLRQAEEKLRTYSWGRQLLGEQEDAGGGAAPASQPATRPASQPASEPGGEPPPESAPQPTLVAKVVDAGTGSAAVKQATRIVNTVVTGVLTLFVVLVTGIYLAAQPRLYVEGLVMLAPHARRARYREVLARLGHTLRWWMIGQLVPMAVIGTLTAVGLKVIGVPMWLFLGLLAGLFNFIPNFGPLISGVPAFLLALSESPTKAMWVVLLYVVAQSLEGYVLTPLVQRRAVEMPPGLLILFQVLAGLLLGALGVVLAAPLLAVALVAIRMLYVEDVLGDKADVPGERDAPGA